MTIYFSGNQVESDRFRVGQGGTEGLTVQDLRMQNRAFKSTGGTSEENRDCGFVPAFLDGHTGMVYVSRFANGQLAPVHLLDGLPAELVVSRSPSGQVAAVSASVIAGFVRGGQFYTREQAADLLGTARRSPYPQQAGQTESYPEP